MKDLFYKVFSPENINILILIFIILIICLLTLTIFTKYDK
ncbi:unknown [Clostridium sp. CAG:710]|nr:unknown [Clostridium sp. CAG:710]